ncbi:MAG TPA: aldo/keto reductase, partial [Ignavibacteria bacterium]
MNIPCRIGLGTNRVRDTKEIRAVLKRAVEIGINFIDTANIYQGGQSEQTIGNTLSPYPKELVIATKSGMVRGSSPNNKPDYLRNCIEESMRKLKVDCITLYQLHRVDPDT